MTRLLVQEVARLKLAPDRAARATQERATHANVWLREFSAACVLLLPDDAVARPLAIRLDTNTGNCDPGAVLMLLPRTRTTRKPMLANDSFHIAVIAGDGIGHEVMAP